MGIVLQDTFTRANVASGFGTATDGNTWTIQSGNGQSVASNEGQISSSSSSTFATLGNALSGADCEGLVRFKAVDILHNTAGIILRWTDANNHWLFRYNGAASPSPGINVMVKVAGTYTSQATIAKSLSGSNFYWLRARAQGTTISIKLWQDGTSEPGAWDGQYTLSSQNVAGKCGLYGFANSTNLTQYDSFSVDDLAAVSGSATMTGQGSLKVVPQGAVAGTGIGDLAVTTPSVAWTGVGGSPGTATRVTYEDSQSSGWSVDLIPSYGGMPIASVQSVDNGTFTQEHSLSTTVPDGHIHWLEQSPGAVFGGSEDVAFTLTEQAPTGTVFRRYYQAVGAVNDALGVAWTAYACIYPGDPGLIAYRFDLHNPSGSAISLNGTDSLEVALIGGLEQADSTWAPANGGYGTVAGSDTVGWPSSLTSIEPDYVYIVPATGGNTNLGQGTVKKTSLSGLGWTSLQIQYLQNSSRLKIKVQGSFASIAAGATQTIYALQVLMRDLTATDMRAIAADYLAPGTPSMTNGTYTSYSYDERAYQFAASNNRLTGTLSLSGTGVTTRFKPVAKITGWSNTSAPILSFNGAALTNNAHYRYYNDTANQTLYIQLYFDIVASGPAVGQRANGVLDVQPSVVSGAATMTGHGTLVADGSTGVVVTGQATMPGHGTLVADGVQVVTKAATVPGHGVLVADGVQVLTKAASETGRGILVVSGYQVLAKAATLTGRGTLVVSVAPMVTGSATVTGRGLLVANGGVAGTAVPGVVALSDALAATVTLSDALAATVILSDRLAATVTLSDAIA